MYTLENCTALITGASSGIGETTALSFARQGCHVALIARRKENLEAVAKQCQDLGVKTLVLPLDITDQAALDEAVQKTVDDFGQLNIVIANHGIYYQDDIQSVDLEKWLQVIDINLRASMGLIHSCVKHVIRCKQNHQEQPAAFVFTGSVAATMNVPKGEDI